MIVNHLQKLTTSYNIKTINFHNNYNTIYYMNKSRYTISRQDIISMITGILIGLIIILIIILPAIS